MKRADTIIRDFVTRSNPDALKYMSTRLNQRIGSDLAEALDMMSEHHDLDRLLSSARTATDLYDLIDQVQVAIDRQLEKLSPELQEA